MRSTTQTDFPVAVSHIRSHDMEALDKLDSLAKDAINAGRRLQTAVRNLDTDAAEDALWHLSSVGSVVNSWTGK